MKQNYKKCLCTGKYASVLSHIIVCELIARSVVPLKWCCHITQCSCVQRREIVTGAVEPTDEECEWQSDKEEDELAVSWYLWESWNHIISIANTYFLGKPFYGSPELLNFSFRDCVLIVDFMNRFTPAGRFAEKSCSGGEAGRFSQRRWSERNPGVLAHHL